MAALHAFMVEVVRKRKAAAQRKQVPRHRPFLRVWSTAVAWGCVRETRHGSVSCCGSSVSPARGSLQSAMVVELEAELASMVSSKQEEMQKVHEVGACGCRCVLPLSRCCVFYPHSVPTADSV